MDNRYAGAGVGVFVVNEKGQILVGIRLAPEGYGLNEWQLPGGKIDHMEDWKDTCVREVAEETGLIVVNPKFLTARNDTWPMVDKHFVTSFFVARAGSGAKPIVMEPTKCKEWRWVDIKDIPQPSFLTLREVAEECYDKIQEYLANNVYMYSPDPEQMFTVKARYYAEQDCFGESFVVQGDNRGKNKNFEVGSKVKITSIERQ